MGDRCYHARLLGDANKGTLAAERPACCEAAAVYKQGACVRLTKSGSTPYKVITRNIPMCPSNCGRQWTKQWEGANQRGSCQCEGCKGTRRHAERETVCAC